MPAIKNIGLKILFSTFLLPVFFCCDKKKSEKKFVIKSANEITSVSVSNIGGNLGSYKIVKITKDSIVAEKGSTALKTHQQWNSALPTGIWKQLISTIHIKDLDQIKSSPSTQIVNGFDETFQIRTLKKSHLYVNSYVDTLHYRQFQQLKDQLNTILPKEYQ